MQADYKAFVDRMIQKYEGLYCWDKGDPGGPTKYGITCFDLAEHRHVRMTSMAAWAPLVQAMLLSEAEDIYAMKYALGINFNALPPGIDCVMMDYAVNSGVARVLAVANTLVGRPRTATLQGLVAQLQVVDRHQFIDAICDERLRFMQAIQGGAMWARFGGGWGTRVADLRAYSHRLAQGQADSSEAADLSKVVTPKAKHQPKTAGVATAGTVIAGAAAVHQYSHSIALTAAVSAAILGAGLAYEVWQEHRTVAANLKVHV